MRSHSIAAASPLWWWLCCCCCLLLTLPSVLGENFLIKWDDETNNFSNAFVTATVGDTVDIEVPENHTAACVWSEETCVQKEELKLSSEEGDKRVYTYPVLNAADMCFVADLELCDQGARSLITAKAPDTDRRPRLSEEGMVIAALVILAMACIMAFIIRFCARHYNPPRRVDPETGTEGWLSQLWTRRVDEEPPPPYVKEEPKPPPYAELSSVSATVTGEASTSASSTALLSTSPSPIAEARNAGSENGSVLAGDPAGDLAGDRPSASSSESAQPDVAQNSDVPDSKPISDASDENMNDVTADASTSSAANVSANAPDTDADADARALTIEAPTSDASDRNAAGSSPAPPSYTE